MWCDGGLQMTRSSRKIAQMHPIEWKIIGASVTGFSHKADATPCQDFHEFQLLGDGWFVAAVSDGAGSAPRSTEGAKAACEGIVSHIGSRRSEFSSASDFHLNEATARAWITEGVELVRGNLCETCDSISAFHATLLGVIAGPIGGLFFHVGDGAGLATNVDDFTSSVLSLPENGEYANQTYFVTQPDWQEHLRLTRFGREFNLITLMSDGVTPFALAPGALGPHVPFLDPLSKFLASQPIEIGRTSLAETFEKEAVRRITGDDKTLVWALRNPAQ